MSIATGQTATYTLLLSSQATLQGAVAFSCSGRPAHSLCTVNPGTAPLGATSVVTVTVATGLAMAELQPPATPFAQRTVWLACFAPALLLIGRRRRKHLLAAAVFTLLLAGLSACGTPRTIPSVATTTPVAPVVTPSGAYSLVVTGTSAGLARSVTLTLAVQ